MKNTFETCCLCGNYFQGYGNNAEPLKAGRCCDWCNRMFVLPARIAQLKNTPEQPKPKVGDRIHIVNMDGEPDYKGREGVIEHIDDIGQLHGTWGGCGILPTVDEYYIIG